MDKINQWLTVVTNLGVIAGFILIAIQLQQNTKALNVQADSLAFSAELSTYVALMGENVSEAFVTAENSPAELTDTQISEVGGFLSTKLAQVDRAFEHYQKGLLTEEKWGVTRQSAVAVLDWPFGRGFWQVNRQWYGPEFVAEIDQGLKHTEGQNNPSYTNTLRDALRNQLAED